MITSATMKQIAANKQTLFEIILPDKKLNNGLNTNALVAVTAIYIPDVLTDIPFITLYVYGTTYFSQ